MTDRSHDAAQFRALSQTRRPGCRLYRADMWKLKRSVGPYYFVIFNYGNGYYVMRLFDDLKSRQYHERRLWKWCRMRPQSAGRITWKQLPK